MMEKNRNILKLSIYMVFMSASIAVPGSLLLIDMLLLRMHFDIKLFGMIKSSMFLVPAIAYWLMANTLRNLRIAPAVCRWAYLTRITVPLVLPLTALHVESATTRMAICIAVFSISFSAAMIANNTLLTLCKAAVPDNSFNRYAAFFTILQGVPSSVLGYPIAKMLGKATLDDTQFLHLFLAIEIVVCLFYIPAFICLRNLKLKDLPPPPKVSFSEYLLPFKDASCRPLFALTFLRNFWMGMLSSYWAVYVLKIRGWNPDTIVIFEMAMMIALVFIAPIFGKIADERGFRICFIGLFLTSLAAAGLQLVFWTSTAFLVIAIIVNHYGNVAIVSTSSLTLLSTAVVVSAPKGHSERYIAAATFFNSIGAFAGCCVASRLFAWLSNGSATDTVVFRNYFTITTLLILPQLACSLMLKERNRRGPAQK